jgi:hypothetical protein
MRHCIYLVISIGNRVATYSTASHTRVQDIGVGF